MLSIFYVKILIDIFDMLVTKPIKLKWPDDKLKVPPRDIWVRARNCIITDSFYLFEPLGDLWLTCAWPTHIPTLN